ncbi:DUF4157 domain-containing protein [Streptomyces niveiscabiei]|uniref:eCIS core domain-containing protein n=1 Tax=Streptomyces niveiscabiei TaxID=164115 RepID=UPI0029BAE382|nr:DUF4157 domain-containing protein [Streptomyces niveiscabiei]MDX3385247.1 DUF4157 domain-containing protein [Streptomyces niveiscabiei]
MHAHERPDRKPAKAPRADRSPGGGAADPRARLLTATVLGALQRSVGNAVVSRLVSGEAEAAESAVQRSTAHDVLRSSGKPLDEPVRAEMESRLGHDFSDVRLHTGQAAQRSAAELGARAWTSGNHVVIGRGGGDPHTLAHELTHVVQQRQGPVSGTDNGSGLSVSDPSDRFEREAEATARRVMSRPVGEAAAAQTAPAHHGHSHGASVQRMEGFEAEVDKRVRDRSGAKLPGDTNLATGAEGAFTVVSDSRSRAGGGSYSNIEFVSGAVQVVGSKRDAGPDELDRIVDEMKRVRDDFYNAVDGTQLADATVGLELLSAAEGVTLSSQGYAERSGQPGRGDGLFVQYTIGVPLAGIPLVFDHYREEAPAVANARQPRALFRLNQARPFAEAEVAKFEGSAAGKKRNRDTSETDTLNGFLQLYFTQVAAVADYVAEPKDKGQIKNRTIFLSRSNLTDTYRLLPEDVQGYLRRNNNHIVSRLAGFQEKTEKEGEKLSFFDRATRQVGELDEVSLETYAKSALTGKPEVSQEQVFGGMKGIPPHPVEGTQVIPMEIRAIGSYLKTWDEVKAELRKIAGWAQEGYERDQELGGGSGTNRSRR